MTSQDHRRYDFPPTVRLELFEGPVELLLYLVRKNELDVLDIPVGRLTDDFLGFVRAAVDLNLEAAADFLVMAGVLLRLKMRRLLPPKAEEDLSTPTVTLDQILDEFRRYQQAARVLSEKEQERRLMFPRPLVVLRDEAATQEEIMVLTLAFRRLLARLKPDRLVEVAPVRIRFEDKLAELRAFLHDRTKADFEEALASNTITELIIMFICVLELVRLGEIRIFQEEQFGRITLELRTETAGTVDSRDTETHIA
ncbi:MAG: segregation/condensation protein A [candidate division WOR-3 bacterium]